MIASTDLFMKGLEEWIKAVRDNDFKSARNFVANCRLRGDLMAIRPELIKCFANHGYEVDPKQALLYACHLFECATEARAQHLKQQSSKD